MADPLLPTAYFNGPITDSGEEFDPELLAEFQREIERHEKVSIYPSEKIIGEIRLKLTFHS